SEAPERDVRPFVVVDIKTSRPRAITPLQRENLAVYAESWAELDAVLAAYRDASRSKWPWRSSALHSALRVLGEGTREQLGSTTARRWEELFEVEDIRKVKRFMRKARLDQSLLGDVFDQ